MTSREQAGNTRRVAWVVVLGWMLLLGACSNNETVDAAADEEAAAEEESDDVYVSPIGEFLGWDTGADFDAEAAQAEWAEQERQAQEAIALCMSAQGFEYIPVDYSGQVALFEDTDDGLEWGGAEWTTKYGFGVSTQRFSQAQVGPDLVGYDDSHFGGFDESGFVDPNQEYLDGLAPAEVEAYYDALYGGPDDYPVPIWEEEGREPTEEEIEAFDREFMENYEPSGCEAEAYEEFYNDEFDDERAQAFEEEFQDLFEQLEERMESHPDVIAHREGVQACVQEAGVEYITEDEAWMYFEEQMDAAGLGWEAMGDPLADVDTTGFTEEDFDRAYREFETTLLPADKLEALAEVQAEEIGVAVALYECGGTWQSEGEVLDAVRIELEEQFLIENADRLAEYEGLFAN